MSQNPSGEWNPIGEENLSDDEFQDSEEEELIVESETDGFEEEFFDPDVEDLDMESVPVIYSVKNEQGEDVFTLDGVNGTAGPSTLQLHLMDVDTLPPVRAEHQPDEGQHGDSDTTNEDEVDPGAMNDVDWMSGERIGDRGHAVVGGRGLVRARGRGRGQGRGRGGNRGRGCRGAVGNVEWVRGEELFEVFPTDEDIPPELRERFVREMPEQVRQEGEAEGNRVNDEDEAGPSDDILQDYEWFCADENASRFVWKPMNSFQGAKEHFRVKETGPTRIFQTGYEAFRAIWDVAATSYIADQTNAYAAFISDTNEEFRAHWYDTNEHEILMLIVFWMMLGIVRMPSINSCFSTDPLLMTYIYRNLFSKRRYWMLNKALRLAPNQTLAENSDKLRHITPIVNILNEKFKQFYTPSQDICIDESLTLWKGGVPIRQYIKTKAAKYGIKSFELYESSTGYLWSFFVYTGAAIDSETTILTKTAVTVLKLICPLLHKGYQVFMDNWFNSPLLARFLKRNKTDCVGTLRWGREHIPPTLASLTLHEGSYIARHAGDVVVVSMHDRRPLLMVSTHHGTEQIRTVAREGRPSQYRFACVADYNAGMGGVDRKDQMLEPYLVERKQCTYWFKKLFKRLVNVSIINSRILVQQSDPARTTIPQFKFRTELVKHLMQNHLHLVPLRPRAQLAVRVFDKDFPTGRILTKRDAFHYPKRREILGESEGGRRTSGKSHTAKRRARCVWCAKRESKESRTVYECSVCKIPLCLEECFAKFHTVR